MSWKLKNDVVSEQVDKIGKIILIKTKMELTISTYTKDRSVNLSNSLTVIFSSARDFPMRAFHL